MGPKIAAVEAIPLQIPFSPGNAGRQGWAGSKWPDLSILLVKVTTDDGLIGWGEAFSYNCLRPAIAVVEDMIAPAVIGRDVFDSARISEDLQRGMHLWGRYGITIFGLSGLDIALWDLRGKASGQPLSALLGGARRTALPGYASLFRYGDADMVAERSERALSEGYKVLKLHEVEPDFLARARAVAGPDIPITVDTNCPWTPQMAREIINRMKPYDPYWVEEPVFPPEDFDNLAAVQRDTGVRLAAGENACTSMDFFKMMKAGAVSFVQPSVTKVGGVTEFAKVCALADKFGVTVMPHSPYFGPGFIASLHLTAALCPEGLVERFHLDCEASLYGGLIDPDSDGNFRLPDGPGLGVEPDPDVIARYKIA